MVCRYRGSYSVDGGRDEEGYRSYTLVSLVRCDVTDGPANVLRTPGLPIPGAPWTFRNDFDLWVWCRPTARVRIHQAKPGYPARAYTVEQIFSNKPLPRDQQRCSNVPIEDPLLEPVKISGTFVKKQEEGVLDRNGQTIKNSSHEFHRGPMNEWDMSLPTVRIEQNVAVLNLGLLANYVDTVSDRTMWGTPARCVKLDNITWERRFHGLCNLYYNRVLDFSVSYRRSPLDNSLESGHDRWLPDVGTKVIRGRWDNNGSSATYRKYLVDSGVNRNDPSHFIRYQDPKGNVSTVVLNGEGAPAIDPDSTATGEGPAHTRIEKYLQTNLFDLGIPLTF